jgi:hypothetical protein
MFRELGAYLKLEEDKWNMMITGDESSFDFSSKAEEISKSWVELSQKWPTSFGNFSKFIYGLSLIIFFPPRRRKLKKITYT